MRSSLSIACSALIVGVAALASMNGACSADGQVSNSSRGTGGSSASGTAAGGSTGSTNPSGGGDILISTGASNTDGGTDPDAACAASEAEATLKKKPVDIIFMIDNSSSMGNEIVAVEDNINTNFANIIAASGIDYRVIMIARHGQANPDESICVKPPLSTTACVPLPGQPGTNPPIFFQYSLEIDSFNSVCRLLTTYNGNTQDEFDLWPMGWSQWARPEAFKVLVEITDDRLSCSINGQSTDDSSTDAGGTAAAATFDAALLALDPVQFGTAADRNYIFHSIVGLAPNNPATAAYQPADPIVTADCNGAYAPGTGYQALSKLTGGLRFPVCEGAGFDVVFQEIAKGVVEGAKVECEFPLPKPPPGETLDLSTVVVQYTPGNMGAPQKLKQVASLAACAPDSFYIENELIKLCPDSCTVIQADSAAKVAVLFGCDPMVN